MRTITVVYVKDWLGIKAGQKVTVQDWEARELINLGIADIPEAPAPPNQGFFSISEPKIWNYGDFSRLRADKRFIIKDFLLPNTVNMLYSPPEQYKSLVSEDLAMAVSHGTPFLGLQTHKWPVLVLDRENNPQLLKNRLETLHRGRKQHGKKYPLYYIVGGGSLDDENFVTYLKKTITEKKIKLVIIDTLHRFSNYDENAANDLNRLYTDVFQPIVSECDSTILFLHHTTKEGTYRGTADFMGMVDAAWSIRKQGKTPRFKLETEKSRCGSPIEKILGEIERGEDYTVIRALDDTVENSEEQKTIAVYKECTWNIMSLFPIPGTELNTPQIREAIEKSGAKFANRTIERGIAFLIREKYLEKRKRGHYSRIGDAETQKRLENVTNLAATNNNVKVEQETKGNGLRVTANDTANVTASFLAVAGKLPPTLPPTGGLYNKPPGGKVAGSQTGELAAAEWVRSQRGHDYEDRCSFCREVKVVAYELVSASEFLCADCYSKIAEEKA